MCGTFPSRYSLSSFLISPFLLSNDLVFGNINSQVW